MFAGLARIKLWFSTLNTCGSSQRLAGFIAKPGKEGLQGPAKIVKRLIKFSWVK